MHAADIALTMREAGLRENGMAEENALEMRAMLGRWSEVSRRWGLDADEEAGLLGDARLTGPVGDPRSWEAGRMERRMRLLNDLAAALAGLFGDEARVRQWLRRPREALSGMSPIEAMTCSVEWIRMLREACTDLFL